MFNNICRLTFVLTAASVMLSAADPMAGTWKFNPAKSKFNPAPGPKSSTMTISVDGDWIVSKNVGEDAAGKPFSRENRYKADGSQYPFDGPTGKGTIKVKKVSEHEYHSQTTGEGGASGTNRTVYSKDGKTRTLTTTGTDSKGQKVNHRLVYDRL